MGLGGGLATNGLSSQQGIELGYAQITSNQPPSPFINSTTAIDIPGMTVTVTVGARPIDVIVSANVQPITNNPTFLSFLLAEDGVVKMTRGMEWPANQNFINETLQFSCRLNPAAGSHTYKLQGLTSNAINTAWLNAGAAPTGPCFIKVNQC